MKRIIALLMGACMMLVASPEVFAAGDYSPGDLVWSEDFQSIAPGTDFAANPTHGMILGGDSVAQKTAEIQQDAVTKNNYLHVSASSGGASAMSAFRMFVPAGDAADNDGIFTLDMDIKLDPYDAATMYNGDSGSPKYAEYNFGLGVSASTRRAYATLSPNLSNAGSGGGFVINGAAERNPTSVFKQAVSGENTGGGTNLLPYAWNTYRLILRQEASTGYYYADLYVNGGYFYLIGQRNSTELMDVLTFEIAFNPGIKAGGASIDNIRCYYGALPVSADGAATKGKFTVTRYDFNDRDAGNLMTGNKLPDGTEAPASTPVIQGGNYDHALGQLVRYNAWSMNIDIEKGVMGKSSEDSTLKVSESGSRIKIIPYGGSDNYTASRSQRYGTWVPEGDSLEFAADVLFQSINENWILQMTTANGNVNTAIEISPTMYSTGHWQDDDFQNNRKFIFPKLPMNKWVKLRVVITRGSSDTPNKLSIYADNLAICENEELVKWHTEADPDNYITGDQLSKGFVNIYFHYQANYDNIEVNKYLCGEEFRISDAKPEITADKNTESATPMARGKLYTSDKTLSDILGEYGVNTDPAIASYVVRDSVGNPVIDYTRLAGGTFLDITTVDGENLYATFASNSALEDITSTPGGAFGGFSLGSVTAASVASGYGRSVSDTNVALSNGTPAAVTMSRTLNSYENNLVEFSFLADENTDFSVGYRVAYIRTDGIDEGFSSKTGATRSYTELITFKDNEITTSDNDGTIRLGSYRDREWTKLRIVFNHLDIPISVSVNDGPAVAVRNGPLAYIYRLLNFYITLGAGKSVALDDFRILEGAKPAVASPAIASIDPANGVYALGGTLSLPAYYDADYTTLNIINNDIVVTPVNAGRQYITSNGSIAASAGTIVDKFVLVNNGCYIYYDVAAREKDITESDNGDGTVKLIVDITNPNITDLTSAKLIMAVYDSAGVKLLSASSSPLVFEDGAYTCAVDIARPSAVLTDRIKYFVWAPETLAPMAESAESRIPAQ